MKSTLLHNDVTSINIPKSLQSGDHSHHRHFIPSPQEFHTQSLLEPLSAFCWREIRAHAGSLSLQK